MPGTVQTPRPRSGGAGQCTDPQARIGGLQVLYSPPRLGSGGVGCCRPLLQAGTGGSECCRDPQAGLGTTPGTVQTPLAPLNSGNDSQRLLMGGFLAYDGARK